MPNLVDPAGSQQRFAWSDARGWLDGLPGNQGLNIAHEAVDRHLQHGRGERIALRWIGKGGERQDLSYSQLAAQSSRFAQALAWEFGLGEPLVYEVKSTSTARSLFYHYDALQRFQDIQSGMAAGDAPPSRYLTINALGQAILNTLPLASRPALPSSQARDDQPGRSVVLIDEIDKAPRDFPNDVLTELEDLYFRIPELGDVVYRADPHLRPLVVLTSNSERDLPDAFLRRCVYYHIPFPNPQRLEEIVAQQLHDHPADSALSCEALALFQRLRDPRSGLRKKPATAELLLWLLTLRHLLGEGAETEGLRGAEQQAAVRRSLSSCVPSPRTCCARPASLQRGRGGGGRRSRRGE
jgi:MoxR-like ATPase